MRTRLLATIALLACSSAPSGDDDGTNSKVTLVINHALAPSEISGLQPSVGNSFEELNIRLENESGHSISASFQLFALETDPLVKLQSSAAINAIATPCQDHVVYDGGAFTCSLVFEVPQNENALTLDYDDTLGDTASAIVPPPSAPVTCDYDSDTNLQCTQCMNLVSDFTCTAETKMRATACEGDETCQSQCGAACGCIQSCASSACTIANKAATDCLYAYCVANGVPGGSPPDCP